MKKIELTKKQKKVLKIVCECAVGVGTAAAGYFYGKHIGFKSGVKSGISDACDYLTDWMNDKDFKNPLSMTVVDNDGEVRAVKELQPVFEAPEKGNYIIKLKGED